MCTTYSRKKQYDLCCVIFSDTLISLAYCFGLGVFEGVNNVEVAVMTKTVKVTHFPSMISPAVLVSALNDAGLQASLGARGHGPGRFFSLCD